MPADEPTLPVVCPHCQHDLAKLTVRSLTILTVTCARCGYTWSSELATMPEPVRVAAQIIALERDMQH
jgi:Zn ribbon nucleic-acid-binding protein